MLLWIIKWIVISLILIALCHNIYIYLKDTFTIPKTRDLIKNPEKRYAEMLGGENVLDLPQPTKEETTTSISELVDPETLMKSELETFMKSL
jgi:hypothetical protein